MRNIKGWIHDFNNLDSDQQLEVAEAIMDDLKANNLVFNKDEYYKERTELVREFFGNLLYCYKGDGKLKKLDEMLKKIDNLSEKNQKALVDEIIYAFQKRIIIQNDEDNKEYCLAHGHNFGKWEHKVHSYTVETRIDLQTIPNFPVTKNIWSRKCSKCGFTEVVYQEPEELYNDRKIKETKAKIKKLTRELEELEKE